MGRRSRGWVLAQWIVLLSPLVLAAFASAQGGGIWIPGPGSALSPGLPPAEEYNAIAADPAHSRLFMIGGYPAPASALWMLDLSAPTPTWQFVAAASPGPGQRVAASLVLDSRRVRLLLMGGMTADFVSAYQDIWSYSLTDGSGWQQILPSGPPPAPRAWHSAVYDSLYDRLVIVGGNGGAGPLGDAWSLELAGSPQWTKLAATGPTPVARYQATLAIDAARDRLVLVGGIGAPGGDVWALPLVPGGEWARLPWTGVAPAARAGAMGTFDSRRSQLVLCGGQATRPSALDSTFFLSFGDTCRWNAATAPTRLRAWYNGAATYDVAHDRVCVFGGIRDSWYEDEASAWDSTSGAWAPLVALGTPNHPTVRVSHAAAVSSATGQLVLTGGRRGDAGLGLDDIWRFDLTGSGGWVLDQPVGAPFAGRFDHGMVSDPATNDLLVFGGAPNTLGQTMQLDPAGAGTWSLVAPAGALPPVTEACGVAFDTRRERLLVACVAPSGGWQVWALPRVAGAAWVSLTASAPSPIVSIWSRAAAYDATEDQLLLVGGDPAQMWAMRFSGPPSWQPLGPASGPALRGDPALAFDPVGRRVWISGGVLPGMDFQADTWEFDIGPRTWTRLSPAGAPPPAREMHTLTFDPLNDRLVLFGGFNGYYLSDTWWLQLEGPTDVLVSPRVEAVTETSVDLSWLLGNGSSLSYAVERRVGEGAWAVVGVASADGTRTVRWTDSGLTPGTSYEYRLADVGTGNWLASSAVTIRTPVAFALSVRTLSRAGSGAALVLRITLPGSSPARLDLVDVAGRRVQSEQLGNLGPGTLDVTIPAGNLRAGIYFAQLTQEPSSARCRCVVLR